MIIGSNGLRQGLDPRPIPIGPASIAAMLDALPETEMIALIDRDGSLTYRMLVERIHAAAVGLQSIGLQPGEMIAACSANVIDLIVAFFAAQRLGAIWVGINRPLAAPEKAVQLADCGARYTGMLGYWNKPDETARAFRDFWLRTGDMGCLDEAGNLILVGRKKEMILRGGANIYPAEIEHVLRTHDKVNDAVIVGLPDDRLGEIVAAYVQVEAGVAAMPGLAVELRSYCLSHVARYKTPERWFVVAEIPRNALNKPMRNLLATTPHVELVQA